MINLNLLKQTVREIIDLSSKSAILADSKSKIFCKQYNELEKMAASNKDANELFLKGLCADHGLPTEKLYKTMASLVNTNENQNDFVKNFKQVNFDKLTASLKPDYYSLFQSLGRVSDGVRTLVRMRQDLLILLEEKKLADVEDLKIMNSVLKNLLSLYFSTGLLNIQKINWNSPASLVEKVAHYESVHQIKSLSDLKNRLNDKNRRCFIYIHSTMPYEPLVILHIALTNSVSSNIKDLIKISVSNDNTNEENGINQYTNAIFYSINSCQKGLQQVDLGNALIKSCVAKLKEEIPSLKNFHTLSPIPKFKDWLDLKIKIYLTSNNSNEYFSLEKCLASDKEDIQSIFNHFNIDDANNFKALFENIQNYLNSSKFRLNLTQNEKTKFDEIIENFLMRSCAFYLYKEKKNGYAFNSVSNFHLKNGAQIYRLNYAADVSDNGLRSSYGLMVNYGYYLDDINSNCINYLIDKKIKVSDLIEKYL